MTTKELMNAVQQLKEWEEIQAEASKKVKELKEILSEEVKKSGNESIEVGAFIIRLTHTISQKFNATLFKKNCPDMYNEYTKETSYDRFSIGLVDANK